MSEQTKNNEQNTESVAAVDPDQFIEDLTAYAPLLFGRLTGLTTFYRVLQNNKNKLVSADFVRLQLYHIAYGTEIIDAYERLFRTLHLIREFLQSFNQFTDVEDSNLLLESVNALYLAFKQPNIVYSRTLRWDGYVSDETVGEAIENLIKLIDKELRLLSNHIDYKPSTELVLNQELGLSLMTLTTQHEKQWRRNQNQVNYALTVAEMLLQAESSQDYLDIFNKIDQAIEASRIFSGRSGDLSFENALIDIILAELFAVQFTQEKLKILQGFVNNIFNTQKSLFPHRENLHAALCHLLDNAETSDENAYLHTYGHIFNIRIQHALVSMGESANILFIPDNKIDKTKVKTSDVPQLHACCLRNDNSVQGTLAEIAVNKAVSFVANLGEWKGDSGAGIEIELPTIKSRQ